MFGRLKAGISICAPSEHWRTVYLDVCIIPLGMTERGAAYSLTGCCIVAPWPTTISVDQMAKQETCLGFHISQASHSKRGGKSYPLHAWGWGICQPCIAR